MAFKNNLSYNKNFNNPMNQINCNIKDEGQNNNQTLYIIHYKF